jgi:hypothetical protein
MSLKLFFFGKSPFAAIKFAFIGSAMVLPMLAVVVASSAWFQEG